ncbi:YkvA family protein [uncultured Maricaulis sp.]|uniref:YkvA family protein n=1 Tax=uncultured Maricaulis sp. TaxID=174710 RepID=UPI0030DB6D72|tara:strand:+ start:97 stop:666 length:570 start_codon:yes stop_codon:yes gene_type:complete
MSAPVQTALKVEFELSESDLDFFRARLAKARDARIADDEAVILEGVAAMSKQAAAANPPAFVRERLEQLGPLVAMLRDADWRLAGDDRKRVLDALAYFADPDDLIPDSTPGIGYIDDAIMIELVANALAPELEAYDDFVAHREEIASGAQDLPSLDDARAVMQSRMRRRRSRSRAGGTWSHSTSVTHYF